jgi:hypothetical protein
MIYAYTAERLSGATINSFRIKKRQSVDAGVVLAFIENKCDPKVTVDGQCSEAIIREAFQDWSPERTDEMLHKLAVLKKSYKKPSHGMKTFLRSLGHRSSKTK